MTEIGAGVIGGPYFEDLAIGDVFRSAAVTLTDGQAAIHQAIVGDRLQLPLSAELAVAVAGGRVVHPGLTWDMAIGQSTEATQRVIANLFYRGLALRRHPRIGDTLQTGVEVVAMRQNRARPGRRPTGLAALRVRTEDQERRPVLDFWRCAMLPLRDAEAQTGRDDDLDAIGADLDAATLAASLEGWDLAAYREAVPGPHFDALSTGEWEVEGGDVVDSAPQLARLTLNLAAAHLDRLASAGGRRLVYGGHTIGLAAAHLTRAFPALLTVVAWRSCDHVGPVYEGDTLRSRVALERLEPLAEGGGLAYLEVVTHAVDEGEEREVLRWRPIAAFA
ncbi:MAG TPA: MaoC family dehydratase [Solirubrobacterales bacterium]|nr:MaoC family dehydratase [Solirubrobacterales bacterium]